MCKINHLGTTKGNNGVDCPLVCPTSCDDDEILCPGQTMSNGCKENDYCHPKGTGYNGHICEGFCPNECNNAEHKCPIPNDPTTDCKRQPLCVPNQYDRWGWKCSEQPCPIECDYTEVLFYH